MIRFMRFSTMVALAASHATDMTSSRYCSTTTNVGDKIMSATVQLDSSTEVVVKRGSSILSSSGKYIAGETLTVSSTFKAQEEYVWITSGATFSAGSCSSTRVIKNPATLLIPSSATAPVTVWAAKSKSISDVRITPIFTLTCCTGVSPPTSTPTRNPTKTSAPSNIPSRVPVTRRPTRPVLDTATPTISLIPTLAPSTLAPAIPTLAPTTSLPTTSLPPTQSPGSSNSFQVHVKFESIGITPAQYQSYNLQITRSKIARHTGLDKSFVTITVSPSTSTSSSRALINTWLNQGRRLLSTRTAVNVTITGFSSLAIATDAKTAASQYISASLINDLNAYYPVQAINLLSSSVVSIGDSFSYSCKLSPTMTLSWTIKPDKQGVRMAMSTTGDVHWLSIGIINSKVKKMVASSGTNIVWLYAPEYNVAGIFKMEGYTADGMTEDTRARMNGTKVIRTSYFNSFAEVVFDRNIDTGISDDEILNLGDGDGNGGGKNKVIWAHGPSWPQKHTKEGFINIVWSTGECEVVEDSSKSVYFVFLLSILPILVAWIPFQNSRLIRYLRFKKFLNQFDISNGGVLMIILFFILTVTISAIKYHDLYSSGSTSSNAILFASGNFAIMCLWLGIICNVKSNIWHYLAGVPWERAIQYHKLLVRLAYLAVIAHFIIVLTAEDSESITESEELASEVVPIYGFVAFVFFSAMAMSALNPIRTKFYQAFVNFHNVYVIVIIMIILHVKWTLFGFIPGLILQGVSWSIKIFHLTNSVEVENASTLCNTESTRIIEITVQLPGFPQYTPGMYYFLNCRELGWLSWHPFSVSSWENNLHGTNKVTAKFHIKVQKFGSWTQRLMALTQEPNKALRLSCHGPFGRMTVTPQDYESIVIVAGGIGITPFLSLLQNFGNLRNRKTKSVEVIWSVRGSGLIACFQSQLAEFMDGGNLKLAITHSSEDASGAQSSERYKWHRLLSPGLQLTSEGRGADADAVPDDIKIRIRIYNSARNAKIHPEAQEVEQPSNNPHIGILNDRPDIPLLLRRIVDDSRLKSLPSSDSISAAEASGTNGRRLLSSPSHSTCVLICGPNLLRETAAKTASELRLDFHSEVFSY